MSQFLFKLKDLPKVNMQFLFLRCSPQIDLTQRLEYLSRAIMCVKSGELAGESSRIKIGELLHDLEEKMEVARVQLMIVNALKQKQSPHNQEMALRRLNSQLIDISELYQTYAEPFDLWECQLAILQCAGKLFQNICLWHTHENQFS